MLSFRFYTDNDAISEKLPASAKINQMLKNAGKAVVRPFPRFAFSKAAALL